MPWEVLKEASGSNDVPADNFWRINFSRVNWDHDLNGSTYSRKKDASGKFLPEYNWVWSPQGVINMHEPEHWGYVYFSTKPVSEEVTFKIPQDEQIRWKLYEFYRAQKAYFSENKTWATSLDALKAEAFQLENKTITPVLENHTYGWSITVESPFSNAVYRIQEDGKYSKLN